MPNKENVIKKKKTVNPNSWKKTHRLELVLTLCGLRRSLLHIHNFRGTSLPTFIIALELQPWLKSMSYYHRAIFHFTICFYLF